MEMIRSVLLFVFLKISKAFKYVLSSDSPVYFNRGFQMPIPDSPVYFNRGIQMPIPDSPVYFNRGIQMPVPDSPVYFNRGIQMPIPAGLRVTIDKPCIIKITNKKKTITGLGTYYGNGHVLTALHVLKDRESDSTTIVMFPTEKGFLGYKAEVTNSCKTYPDRDQAFLKLLGDTDLLGDGLQNQIGRVDENMRGYFYTLSDSDCFKKQECRVVLPSNKDPQTYDGKFLLNRAGRAGDSGSAVFCNGKWVGIYRGAKSNDGRTIEYGFGTELDPEMNLLASPANQLHYISSCAI